jgi:hypothetical protein
VVSGRQDDTLGARLAALVPIRGDRLPSSAAGGEELGGPYGPGGEGVGGAPAQEEPMASSSC